MMQRIEREIERKGRARICKRSKSPGIDFKESIPPANVAWRAGKIGEGGEKMDRIYVHCTAVCKERNR